MSDCQHPNLFFKEFKFYCRTCGEEVNEDGWNAGYDE